MDCRLCEYEFQAEQQAQDREADEAYAQMMDERLVDESEVLDAHLDNLNNLGKEAE
jgi:rubredoxin